MPIIFKYGSLKLLELSGPVQVCNGISLPFLPLPLPEENELVWNKLSVTFFRRRFKSSGIFAEDSSPLRYSLKTEVFDDIRWRFESPVILRTVVKFIVLDASAVHKKMLHIWQLDANLDGSSVCRNVSSCNPNDTS